MKNFFFVFKARIILIAFLICVFCFGGVLFYFFRTTTVDSPSLGYSIIIDAGHGGKDGGAVGKGGTEESRLNLDYALELEKICKSAGMKTILTRKDMEGLYSPLAQNKKRSEMERREEIINGSEGEIVVSIHMNSFPLSSLKGAQVFYKENSESGKSLATSVENNLAGGGIEIRGGASVGDYYVLNCTEKPAILVECGFLSNEEEEKRLCEEEYRRKFCEMLFCGILEFYSL